MAKVNVANMVTVGRVFLTMGTIALLFVPGDALQWTAFWLTAFIIYADALDGYLARKFNLTSPFGAMLDIAGDRVVEMVYWITFAVLGWIPLWVPLLYVVRGTFVDGIRSQASEKGFTPFGEKTMMQTKLGKFLVASNFSRFSYAVAKAIAFCLLIAAHTTLGKTMPVNEVAMFFVYFSCFFCVVRGLPVLVEAKSILSQ